MNVVMMVAANVGSENHLLPVDVEQPAGLLGCPCWVCARRDQGCPTQFNEVCARSGDVGRITRTMLRAVAASSSKTVGLVRCWSQPLTGNTSDLPYKL